MTHETAFWDAAREAADDWSAIEDELACDAVRISLEVSEEAGARLRAAGISDEVQGLADLAAVPVLAKDELPELQTPERPFAGMLGVGIGELRRVYQSPGPINDPEGRVSDYWRMAPAVWAAGFRPGDVVLNTFSYHLTPGGHMLDAGLREVGCVVVPGGVGNTLAQVEFAIGVGVRGYVGTPQFLLTLLQRAAEEDLDLQIERALVTGAPLPPDLRNELEDAHGVAVSQAYGTADAGALGYECLVANGWHVAPGVVVEILDPTTGEPCDPGVPGEVVVTSPNPVYPLIRFGIGDLSALDRTVCPCGRTSPRLMGFLGRSGEGIKVRGMFVHPRQLHAALGTDEIARYHGAVTSEDHQDVLTVRVEPRPGRTLSAEALADRLRETTKVRVLVERVEPGTLTEDGPVLEDAR